MKDFDNQNLELTTKTHKKNLEYSQVCTRNEGEWLKEYLLDYFGLIIRLF